MLGVDLADRGQHLGVLRREVLRPPHRVVALAARITEVVAAPLDSKFGDGAERVVGTEEDDQSFDAFLAQLRCCVERGHTLLASEPRGRTRSAARSPLFSTIWLIKSSCGW